MLMGGAVDVWMLHLGRFLTGLAGGMTAASIPVRYYGRIVVRMTYFFTYLSLHLFFFFFCTSYSK